MAGSPLVLPDELANLLNMLGYTWPNSDEVQMFDLGNRWMEFGSTLQEIQGESEPHAKRVMGENQGKEIEAFAKRWEDENSAPKVTKDAGTAGMVIGGGLFVAAGLVLALKITVIVQLTLLAIQIATAIASAAATFGASMAWIPVAKKLAGMAIELAIDQVINVILG